MRTLRQGKAAQAPPMKNGLFLLKVVGVLTVVLAIAAIEMLTVNISGRR